MQPGFGRCRAVSLPYLTLPWAVSHLSQARNLCSPRLSGRSGAVRQPTGEVVGRRSPSVVISGRARYGFRIGAIGRVPTFARLIAAKPEARNNEANENSLRKLVGRPRDTVRYGLRVSAVRARC